MSLDLNKLSAFVRAMDAGSFTQAARVLRQPKSRVARNVAALEREIGTSLIYRTTRRFSPTDAGRALHARCRDLIYALEGAAADLGASTGELSGRLRITAPEDAGTMLLAPVVAELAEAHPKLDFELHLSNEVVDLVGQGFDVAMRAGPLEDASLKARLIGQICMILVASPAYLKSAPRLAQPKDLEKHRLLDFSGDSAEDGDTEWRLESDRGRVERVRVRARCLANVPKVLVDLAVAGQGVALVPEFLCVEAIKQRRLRKVFENYSAGTVPIHFVWPAHRETSSKLRAFVDLAVPRLKPYFARG